MTDYHIKPASEPPPVSVKRMAGRRSSVPVLAWVAEHLGSYGVIPGMWAVCVYYKDNYGDGWHTCCGKEWNITGLVTHWVDLPKPITEE